MPADDTSLDEQTWSLTLSNTFKTSRMTEDDVPLYYRETNILDGPILLRGKKHGCKCTLSTKGPQRELYKYQSLEGLFLAPHTITTYQDMVAVGSTNGYIHVLRINPPSRVVRGLDRCLDVVCVFRAYSGPNVDVSCSCLCFINSEFLAVGLSNCNCNVFHIWEGPPRAAADLSLLKDGLHVERRATIKHCSPPTMIVANRAKTSLLYTLTAEHVLFRVDLAAKTIAPVHALEDEIEAICPVPCRPGCLLCVTVTGTMAVLDVNTWRVMETARLRRAADTLHARASSDSDFILIHSDDSVVRVFTNRLVMCAKYKNVKYGRRGDRSLRIIKTETSKFGIFNAFLVSCKPNGHVHVFKPFKHYLDNPVLFRDVSKQRCSACQGKCYRYSLHSSVTVFAAIDSREVQDVAVAPPKLCFGPDGPSDEPSVFLVTRDATSPGARTKLPLHVQEVSRARDVILVTADKDGALSAYLLRIK